MAGPKQEGMPFRGMIKLKLKFFKSMLNKITKCIFYFSFILEFFLIKIKKKKKEKRLLDTKTYQQWEEGKIRRKNKKEKRKVKKKID